jgi:hypothetical protein
VLTYRFAHLEPTANYGELLLPPAAVPTRPYDAPGGARFSFGELSGQWILVASDPGDCGPACRDKLVLMRQVRLALGRAASRVARLLVLNGGSGLPADAMAEFEGLRVALAPGAPQGLTGDAGHIYLADPRGNVMMRWPARADGKRMLGDLKRLLKASQIG